MPIPAQIWPFLLTKLKETCTMLSVRPGPCVPPPPYKPKLAFGIPPPSPTRTNVIDGQVLRAKSDQFCGA